MRLNRLGQGTGLVWGRLVVAGAILGTLAGVTLWTGSRAGRAMTAASSQGRSANLSSTNLSSTSLTSTTPKAAAPQQVLKTLGQLPLMFEPNLGQTDARVKYMARGSGFGLFLTGQEAVLSLASQPSKDAKVAAPAVVRMRLSGASPNAKVAGTEPLPGKSNYFIGKDAAKWHHDVPQFARVKYEGVYPGIDLVYYGNQGELEYDFSVAPGADPKVVRLNFKGAEKVALESGDLALSTRNGNVRLHAPRVYQMNGSTAQTVDAHFALLAKNEVGFALGSYDHSRTLVIDPLLTYSTYLGGTKTEAAPLIAVDSAFNFYVAGTTTSADFPGTSASSYQQNLKGNANAFVAKFDSSGSTLLYSTYLGGSGVDTPAGLTIDAAFNIYLAGTTTSTDFPTTASNAYQAASKTGSGTHGFISEINPTLAGASALLYSTYLSGSGTDTISGLTIDSQGVVYVIGITNSTDFPIAPSQGALQNTIQGPNAFFVSKVDPAQTAAASLVYSTYFGGSFPTNAVVAGGGIAVDNNSAGSNIFITGGTNYQYNGNTTDFPIKNAAQGCLDLPLSGGANGHCDQSKTALDAFIAKINPINTSGAQLIYCTYLGGSGDDIGNGIGLDPAGNAYITGSTTSTEPSVLFGGALAFQSGNNGKTDAFVGKVTNPVAGSNNSNVVFSYFSYLGGTGDDTASAIAVDSVQGALITGKTDSTDLATTSNAVQSTLGGGTDAFVARLDTLGGVPGSDSGIFVTYLGGTGNDRGTGIAVDSNAITYVAGDTTSTNFPTAAPFQGSLKGTQDAFAAKLGPAVNLKVTATQTANAVNAGNQATFNYTITNMGDTVAGVAFVDNLLNSGVVANFISATASGGSCPTTPTNNSIICNIGVLNGGATSTVSIVLTPTSSGTLSNSGTVIVAGSSFSASASASLSVNAFTLDVQPPSQTVAAGNPATFTPTLTPVGTKGTYSASISLACPSGLPNGVTCTFSTSPVTLENQSPSSVTLTMDTTARTSTTASMRPSGPAYAMWLPIGGLALFGVGIGGTLSRKRRVLGGLLVLLLLTLVAMQPACSHSSSTTLNSGTPAGTYAITVSATSGTYSQTHQIQLVVQ